MIKNKNSKYKINAFTLAEVLITLGIIGVVAAMTIPTLLIKKEKQEYLSKVKKTYSTLENAIKMAEAENGSFNDWVYGTVSYDGDEAISFAETYLIPYLNIAKNCGKGSGCWATKINLYNGGTSHHDDRNRFSKFILADGTAVHVTTFAASCFIHFDINGLNGPNIYGYDILTYNISPGSKLGIGVNWSRDKILTDANNGCNKFSEQADTCLKMIVQDGWQIKDDYPWP